MRARLPCSSLSPRVCSDSCTLTQWCYLITCLLSFPSPALSLSQHQGLFQGVRIFTSGGQIIGASVSAPVHPMNLQGWLPLEWTGWISLQTLKSLLQQHSSKASILRHSAFFIVQLSHPYMTSGKTIALVWHNFAVWRFIVWMNDNELTKPLPFDS